MTEYVIIPKNEYDIRKKDIILTEQDIQELLEYRDVFLKFLDKSRFSFQIELCKWTFRWKEESLYRSIDTIDEIKNSLDKLENTYKEFKEKHS